MSGDVATRVARWRAEGLDRVDPVAFMRIEALLRRAAARDGTVRGLLDARLAALAEDYAARVDTARHRGDATCVRAAGDGPMGALLSALAHARATVPHAPSPPGEPTPPRVEPLDDVRRLSLRARNASQLRQTLGPVPENAGPLNSARLVQRALAAMRGTCPAYLEALLQHADTLAWLEALPLETALAPATTKAPAAPRARARTRKARD